MGKPFAQAKGEVAKCASGFRWFAEHAERLLADEQVPVDATLGKVIYQPLGVVLAIMPWNFPLWQVTRFIAPAVMAGNVGLLKHAPNVPRAALLLEDLFRRAGAEDGIFQTLLIGTDQVPGIIADPRVAAVTLTGSVGAGRAVAAQAGAVGKKIVLELGGSDPFIVLASADLARAISVGVEARVQNAGQSCIAAKRFIVHEAVAEEFTRGFVAGMEALSVGDPFDPATEVGPLVTAAAFDTIAAQVEDARAHGATILCGGERVVGPEGPGHPGFFYRPTVISDITPAMRVATEEVFGPVALLYTAVDADEALALANGTEFGLGSSVWTTDGEEQQKFVLALQAGQVFVNEMVSSKPELPFGGIKSSGIGRELAAPGLHEFCNIKSVWVA
jgi:succinate-semialdehyde dehydrogenase / glutarate-semialdehyde dehydrogenase